MKSTTTLRDTAAISSCLGFGSWTLFEPGTPTCFPPITYSTYPIHASSIWLQSQKTRRWVEQACKHARLLLYRANKGKVINLAHRPHIIICINITKWLKNPNRLYQKFLYGHFMSFSSISLFFAEWWNLVRAIWCIDNNKFHYNIFLSFGLQDWLQVLSKDQPPFFWNCMF